MSVLIESLTVVVRRLTIDMNWRGGTAVYLAAAVSGDSPARLACADEQLTAVSFLSLEDCQAWIDRLEDCGIVHLADDRCIDVALVDQQRGPTTLCDWIESRQHPDGFSYAWLAGTEPGDVVAPTTRRPSESRQIERTGPADDERMIQLATEDGLEYWLDLETGEQIVGLARSDTSSKPEPPPRRDDAPLMELVVSTMKGLEWTPESHDEHLLSIRISGQRLVFTMIVLADDAARTIACTGVLPIVVEPEKRLAVAEAVVRINRGLRLGSFDLDFGDGELRYRVGCDVEGGALTEHMVMTMIGNVCVSIDRFAPALTEVVFGQVSPEDAARRALSTDP